MVELKKDHFSACIISLVSLVANMDNVICKGFLYRKIESILKSYITLRGGNARGIKDISNEINAILFKKCIDQFIEFLEMAYVCGYIKNGPRLINTKLLLALKLDYASYGKIKIKLPRKMKEKLEPEEGSLAAMILEEITKNKTPISNQLIFQKFHDISQRTIRRHLSELSSSKRIKRTQTGKKVIYEILTDY